MYRVLSYLKPWVFLVLLTVVLLFVQANLELAMPDYMSRIVSQGLQQGGIEEVLPEALSPEDLGDLASGLEGAQAGEFFGLYALVPAGGSTASSTEDQLVLVDRWPALRDRDLMILDKTRLLDLEARDKAGLEELRTAVARQLLVQGAGGQMVQGIMAMDGSLARQSAIQALAPAYKALGNDLEARQRGYIWQTGLIMLLLSLASAAITIITVYFAARVSAGVAKNLRRDLFAKVESFSAAEFDRFSTASLITRTTNDITQIQHMTFMMMRLWLYAPIMGIGGVIRAVGTAPDMAWVIGLSVGALLVIFATVTSIAMPRFRLVQRLVDRVNLVARENLSGLMVVRAFNRQNFEEARFGKANDDLTDNNLFIGRVMSFAMPLMMLLMNVISVIIIWLGATQISQGGMQVGDMMAFLQYAMQIFWAFMMLSMIFFMLPRAMVAAGRISEVLGTDASVKDPANPRSLTAPKGRIEFRNVSFRYPGGEADAISNVSFTLEPGRVTALIGATGSGKSTVVNLIPRFYDPTQGQILLDGVDIRELTQQDLRSCLGFVPQKNSLFTGTLASNLRYADPQASDQELWEHLETAQAKDFVQEREEGLAAPVAQGGHNLSGGQRQRVAIARALSRKAPVYLFDDSFSALDFRTDQALRQELRKKAADSAMLIVAQRVSTIMHAQEILVMADGAIVGRGTHQELLNTCPTYSEIALSQLGSKELS